MKLATRIRATGADLPVGHIIQVDTDRIHLPAYTHNPKTLPLNDVTRCDQRHTLYLNCRMFERLPICGQCLAAG